MNYLSKVWNAVLGRTEGKSVSATGQVGWTPRYPVWTGADEIWSQDSTDLERTYAKSGIVMACIREKATSISQAPLEVGYYEGGAFTPVPDHESLAMFVDNPDYSYAQIIELMVSRLELTGASFNMLWPYKNRVGIGGITPLPTHIASIKASGPTINGYSIIGNNNKSLDVPVEEMCFLRYVDPYRYQGYVSPLASVQRDLLMDTERQNLTVELLRNKKVPGLFLESESVISPENRSLLKASLDASVGRDSGNRGEALILPKGLKVGKGVEVSDIDFAGLNSLTESRICMAFQVPPIIIGAKAGLEKSTYANYETAVKSFYSETLIPLWHFLADGLTRGILSDGLRFRFDLSNITELQTNKNEVATRAAVLFEKKIITKNEARGMLELDPVEDGDGFTAPPAPFTLPEEGKRAFPKATTLEDAIKAEFRYQKKLVIEALQNRRDPDMGVIGRGMGKRIRPALEQIYNETARKTLKALFSKTHKEIEGKEIIDSFSTVNPFLEKAIENQAMRLSEETLATTDKMLTDVLTKTRRGLIAEGVYGENTIPLLTAAVSDAFENMETWRAKRIAITESGRAVEDSEIIASDMSGVVQGFYPIVSADACDICKSYIGSYTTIQDALSQVGNYDYRSLPLYHPNCQCTKGVVLDTEDAPGGK